MKDQRRHMKQKFGKANNLRLRTCLTCIAATCGMWHASANAFQFDVGNPDIEMEWDNTIRADYDMRLQHPDSFYTNTPLYDEGDLSTPKLSTIQSMLNLYSEFD